MKKAILFFLFLVPLLATAQQVTLDTTFIVWLNGMGHERREIVWDNGADSRVTNPNPIGDSTAVEKYLFAKPVNAYQEVGGAAIAYLNGEPVAKSTFSAFSTMYQALTGTSLQVAMNNFFKEQVLGQYQIFSNGTNLGAYELVQQPNGTLRMRLISDPTTFFVVGTRSQNTIQINNLDGVNNVLMHLVGTNAGGKPLYRSIDRKYRLVKTN